MEAPRIASGRAPQSIQDRPLVVRLTAPNPGPKTLGGTHTYIVGRSPAYAIDPGPPIPEYQEEVATWMRKEDLKPAGILLSHGHPDHAPGAPALAALLAVPIWASGEMPDRDREMLGVSRTFGDRQTFETDGDALHVLASPGHTPDHVAFWLEESRVLFAGDVILGEGTTLVAPPEGDMRRYMATLERFRLLRPRLIAPGHGAMIERPEEKITEYVRHREEREQQVLKALNSAPATIEQLVRRIYTDIAPDLIPLAAGSVAAQLEKLEAEGRVRRTGDVFRFRTGDSQ